MPSRAHACASGSPSIVAAACSALLVASGAAAQPRASGADCGRGCLRAYISAYLGALAAHDAGALPVPDGVRFTEDAVTLSLGEGLRQSAPGLRRPHSRRRSVPALNTRAASDRVDRRE